MAIEIGLAKAPFTDLVVQPNLSLCPPFDLDCEKDRILLILDNLSFSQVIKTLLYTGIVLFE